MSRWLFKFAWPNVLMILVVALLQLNAPPLPRAKADQNASTTPTTNAETAVKLYQVYFGGSTTQFVQLQATTQPIYSDNGYGPVYAPQIDFSGTTQPTTFPVCYVWNSTPDIHPIFIGSTTQAVINKTISIVAIATQKGGSGSAQIKYTGIATFNANGFADAGSLTPSAIGSATQPILDKFIDNAKLNIAWTATFTDVGGEPCQPQTSNVLYVIGASSTGTPTTTRVDWATKTATGSSSITNAADKFHTAIATNPGYASPRAFNLNAWDFLDSKVSGDCGTLANVCVSGLGILGFQATLRFAYPTADASGIKDAAGNLVFPQNVTTTTCTAETDWTSTFNGNVFNTKLVYPGNNYEGFFTVQDPGIKAYTVYKPNGPYITQYYYLEVLQSADGVNGDQFWVWNKDQGTPPNNVLNWTQTNQAHIPLPTPPAN